MAFASLAIRFSNFFSSMANACFSVMIFPFFHVVFDCPKTIIPKFKCTTIFDHVFVIDEGPWRRRSTWPGLYPLQKIPQKSNLPQPLSRGREREGLHMFLGVVVQMNGVVVQMNGVVVVQMNGNLGLDTFRYMGV